MTVSIFKKEIPLVFFELEKLPPASEQEISFDEDVLKRVVKRSDQLEALSLERMNEISEPARQSLTNMMFKICESNRNLLWLSLFGFSDNV